MKKGWGAAAAAAAVVLLDWASFFASAVPLGGPSTVAITRRAQTDSH